MKPICALALSLALAGGLAMSAESPEPLKGMRPYLVAISVKSLDESAAWYSGVLGLRLVEKKDFPDHGLSIALLESEGFRLELVQLKGSVASIDCAPDPSNPASLQGVGKYAFQVDDLSDVVSTLKKRGAQIFRSFSDAAKPRETSVIIKDNDGNWIQFFQRPR